MENNQTEVDVYIDLENDVFHNDRAHNIENAGNFLSRLRFALVANGYTPKRIFTAVSNRFRHVSYSERLAIQKACSDNNTEINWCFTIADTALINKMLSDAEKKQLTKVVFLVSNDKHFVPTVRHLVGLGHEIMILGNCVSNKLRRAAYKTLHLKEFMYGSANTADLVKEFHAKPLQNSLPL